MSTFSTFTIFSLYIPNDITQFPESIINYNYNIMNYLEHGYTFVPINYLRQIDHS